MMRPIWSPTVSGSSHQPSAHARMPRSLHIRAYSATRSSTTAGIAPSEWLIRYVVWSRIGKRSRYSANSIAREPTAVDESSHMRHSKGQTQPFATRLGRTPGLWTHCHAFVTARVRACWFRLVRSGQLALCWSDIARRRPEEAPGSLLLEDVRGPAADARAREHRRRERRRNLRDVEHDRRVVLDVRREHTIRRPFLQRLQRDRFEVFRDLHVRRAELLRGALEDARARVFGAVDAVAEAHDPLLLLERLTDPLLWIAHALHFLEHRLHVRRRTAVQRARERTDRRGQSRAAIGARRRDDACGERRRVQAVFGGADPVGVDRLHVARIGLAAPAQK